MGATLAPLPPVAGEALRAAGADAAGAPATPGAAPRGVRVSGLTLRLSSPLPPPPPPPPPPHAAKAAPGEGDRPLGPAVQVPAADALRAAEPSSAAGRLLEPTMDPAAARPAALPSAGVAAGADAAAAPELTASRDGALMGSGSPAARRAGVSGCPARSVDAQGVYAASCGRAGGGAEAAGGASGASCSSGFPSTCAAGQMPLTLAQRRAGREACNCAAANPAHGTVAAQLCSGALRS